MTGEELMTEDVTTVEETATVGDALQLMSERDIRHLPVLRDGEVVGMLSERDLRMLGLGPVTDLEGLERVRAQMSQPILTVMHGDVVSIGRATELQEIIELMISEKIGALPVVDEDTNDLVGIVSYVDVLRAARDRID